MEKGIIEMCCLELNADISQKETSESQTNASNSTNNVRALAKMFEQLQKLSAVNSNPKKLPSADLGRKDNSGCPMNSKNTRPILNTIDCEVEPSTLSLSERVRFFNGLSDTRSSCDRGHTRRDSNYKDATIVKKADVVKCQATIANKTKPLSPTEIVQQPTASTCDLTTTRKVVKHKMIGRLVLPHTFQDDDPNNKEEESKHVSGDDNVTGTKTKISAAFEKKIGRIKSSCVENFNQLMQRQTLSTNNKSVKMDLKPRSYRSLVPGENIITNENNSDVKLNVTNRKVKYRSNEGSNNPGKENINVAEKRKKFSPNATENNNIKTTRRTIASSPKILSELLDTNSSTVKARALTTLPDKYRKYFGI